MSPSATDQQDENELSSLLEGLKTDAAAYFHKAAAALAEIGEEDLRSFRYLLERDEFWLQLPEENRSEAKR